MLASRSATRRIGVTPPNVVMAVPPLTITREEVDEGLAILDETLAIADEYVS